MPVYMMPTEPPCIHAHTQPALQSPAGYPPYAGPHRRREVARSPEKFSNAQLLRGLRIDLHSLLLRETMEVGSVPVGCLCRCVCINRRCARLWLKRLNAVICLRGLLCFGGRQRNTPCDKHYLTLMLICSIGM